jgi:uncharacterized membrane protein
MRPRDLGVVLRGGSILAITGFCLTAFLLQLVLELRGQGESIHAFVNRNQLDAQGRTRLLLLLGAGAACGAITALAQYFWRFRGRSAVDRAVRVQKTSRLLCPLMLPGLAWPLLIATEWDALPRVTAIVMVALLTEVCFRYAAGEWIAGNIAPGRRYRRLISPEMVLVLLGACFYAAWMSYGTILQHRQFATATFDLGNYDSMFFNALHGHPFRCPAVFPKGGDWSMLSTHSEFTMFVLLPFYAIHPDSETLLVMQAVALASGAIPVYRFASRRLPRWAALVLALAYLLYAPMHEANLYDIHFQPFAAAFTLWALDMLDARRPVLFTVFFLLAIGSREDVPIGFAVVGAYLLLVGKHTRPAILMSVVAVTYFVGLKFVVMPRFGSWWFSDLYKDLYPQGENSYGGVVKTLLSNPLFVLKTLITPDKIVLFLQVVAPLVFLPLRRGLLWMSLLPALPFTLLTTGYHPTIEISFQYVLLYVPFVFLATALALASNRETVSGRASLAGSMAGIAMATLLTTRVWGAMPPGDKFRGGFRNITEFRPVSAQEKQKARDIADLVVKIPKDAALAAPDYELPHVSARLLCFSLRSGYEGADYILYQEGGAGEDQARQALSSGEYELFDRRAGSAMAMLKKKGL